MGVIYTDEASKIFLDLIRKNKSCSINEAVKECQKQGVGCGHASSHGKDKVNLAQGLTFCELCDVHTPDTDDDCCLCCGSRKE